MKTYTSWQIKDIPPHILELNRETLKYALDGPKTASPDTLPVSTPINDTGAKSAVLRDKLEGALLQDIQTYGLPDPVREYSFHPTRRWRFDFAWPDVKIACEVEGGIWVRGRHSRGGGYQQDCTKYNEALLLGWRVLRVTGRHINNGMAVAWLMDLLNPSR